MIAGKYPVLILEMAENHTIGHRISNNTAKCSGLYSQFLLCFTKASITVFSAKVVQISLCCVLRGGTIRKLVRAVDKKQDISLLWQDLKYLFLTLPNSDSGRREI